ncbi:hypothetical protein J4E91_004979 [Alternaria rosae]|nr:hypothetical protein J4E91_004979 [Alternaria rosae]
MLAYELGKHAGASSNKKSCLIYTEFTNVKAAEQTLDTAIWELMQACILKPRLVATPSAAFQLEVVQRILKPSDVDKFDMILFDEVPHVTEAFLMLMLAMEWFLDVCLVVFGGEHLRLPPVI